MPAAQAPGRYTGWFTLKSKAMKSALYFLIVIDSLVNEIFGTMQKEHIGQKQNTLDYLKA
jgi:hypothetical protein